VYIAVEYGKDYRNYIQRQKVELVCHKLTSLMLI